MKCNLDCAYCETGVYGGHDNSTRHPPVSDCLKTIDFMFEYVDLYMRGRIASLKTVVLNVYGGEALHHPHIVEILQAIRQRHQPYQSQWRLTVTTTTNAVISKKKLAAVRPLIDEFTVSYHTGATLKQKQQIRSNLLAVKSSAKCVVMMNPVNFADATAHITWCQQHGIRYLAKPIDHPIEKTQFNYDVQQVHWLRNTYHTQSYNSKSQTPELIQDQHNRIDLADSGRACCGGRIFCQDQNYRSRTAFVANKFPDWYCSVNHFFLYVKQVTGEIFTNKDCKMNFDGSVAPIGTLAHSELLLEQTQHWLNTGTMPVIQCKKYRCDCGLCAPKAADLDTYRSIMRKYEIPNSNLLS